VQRFKKKIVMLSGLAREFILRTSHKSTEKEGNCGQKFIYVPQ